MQDLIAKAATLLEALPYLQKFRGATFVVKYGDYLPAAVDDDWIDSRRLKENDIPRHAVADVRVAAYRGYQ